MSTFSKLNLKPPKNNMPMFVHPATRMKQKVFRNSSRKMDFSSGQKRRFETDDSDEDSGDPDDSDEDLIAPKVPEHASKKHKQKNRVDMLEYDPNVLNINVHDLTGPNDHEPHDIVRTTLTSKDLEKGIEYISFNICFWTFISNYLKWLEIIAPLSIDDSRRKYVHTYSMIGAIADPTAYGADSKTVAFEETSTYSVSHRRGLQIYIPCDFHASALGMWLYAKQFALLAQGVEDGFVMDCFEQLIGGGEFAGYYTAQSIDSNVYAHDITESKYLNTRETEFGYMNKHFKADGKFVEMNNNNVRDQSGEADSMIFSEKTANFLVLTPHENATANNLKNVLGASKPFDFDSYVMEIGGKKAYVQQSFNTNRTETLDVFDSMDQVGDFQTSGELPRLGQEDYVFHPNHYDRQIINYDDKNEHTVTLDHMIDYSGVGSTDNILKGDWMGADKTFKYLLDKEESLDPGFKSKFLTSSVYSLLSNSKLGRDWRLKESKLLQIADMDKTYYHSPAFDMIDGGTRLNMIHNPKEDNLFAAMFNVVRELVSGLLMEKENQRTVQGMVLAYSRMYTYIEGTALEKIHKLMYDHMRDPVLIDLFGINMIQDITSMAAVNDSANPTSQALSEVFSPFHKSLFMCYVMNVNHNHTKGDGGHTVFRRKWEDIIMNANVSKKMLKQYAIKLKMPPFYGFIITRTCDILCQDALSIASGGRCARRFRGKDLYTVGNDPTSQYLTGHLTSTGCTAVTNIRNKYLAKSIYMHRYIRGLGCKYYDANDPNHRKDYNPGALRPKYGPDNDLSIHIIPVPPHDLKHLGNRFSRTGSYEIPLHHLNLKKDLSQGRKKDHYSTVGVMKKVWKAFSKNPLRKRRVLLARAHIPEQVCLIMDRGYTRAAKPNQDCTDITMVCTQQQTGCLSMCVFPGNYEILNGASRISVEDPVFKAAVSSR